ncbi:U3 snoRNP protein [Mortierella sp. GBA39]|nr:U3 snoRNP protein [Mortierella sp. GBA39]
MAEFARTDTSFSAASTLIADLNLNSTAHIDVPDFGRCMDALKLLTNSLYKDLNGRQWPLVLHNMIYIHLDPRNTQYELFRGLLAHVVYPGIKKGFKSPFGLVRFGFVAVLAHAVGGDEKASFFTNLYRIQLQHSIRALNRFAE